MNHGSCNNPWWAKPETGTLDSKHNSKSLSPKVFKQISRVVWKTVINTDVFPVHSSPLIYADLVIANFISFEHYF